MPDPPPGPALSGPFPASMLAPPLMLEDFFQLNMSKADSSPETAARARDDISRNGSMETGKNKMNTARQYACR